MQDSKVTLFILKEDKDLYAFSDDKKIVIEFMCTREMDNFIIKISILFIFFSIILFVAF